MTEELVHIKLQVKAEKSIVTVEPPLLASTDRKVTMDKL